MPFRRSPLLSAWDFATLAGLLGLGGFYRWILPQLPDPVPTKFTSLGQACAWTPKGQLAWLVFGMPLFLWGVLFLVGAAVALLPQKAGGGMRVPVHPMRGLLGLGGCLLMAGCVLTVQQGLTALYSGMLAFGVCLVLGLVFVLRDTWQAIARLPRSGPGRRGVLYVNPQDPRLWVEKPVGIGWTLNFAHPAAKWVMALLVAGVLGVAAAAVRTLAR